MKEHGFARFSRARYRMPMLSALFIAFALPAFSAPTVGTATPAAPTTTTSNLPDVTSQLSAVKIGTRISVVQSIINHSATASADALTEASVVETNPDLRVRLLAAAFEVDKDSAVPFLIAALRGDASVVVRAVSAQILARATPSDKVRRAFLDGYAKDANVDVRRACLVGLGSQPHAESLKVLTAAALDNDREIRLRAGIALTRHPKSVERDRALDRLENDRDPIVAGRIHARRRAGETGAR